MDSPFESSDESALDEKSGEESEQEAGANEHDEVKSSASENEEKSSSDGESSEGNAAVQSESDDGDPANEVNSGDEQHGNQADSDEDRAQVDSDAKEDNSDDADHPASDENVGTNQAASDSGDSESEKDYDGAEVENDPSGDDSSIGDEFAKTEPVGSGSDKEDEQTEAAKSDLFGDADDISSSDEEKAESEHETPVNQEERALVFSDEEEEDTTKHQAEEELQETRIEVEIPRINTNLGKAIHFVRFPNFVSVETRPFDPAVYEDEIEDDELMDEEGRTRMKLKVENTIRWKKYTDENGINITESNARLIKWSDGSLSMHLGSEIFDVYAMPLQGDHNHLFIRQGTGLQGQAVFKTKLTFRPHSTKSATHRKMTSRLAMRLNQSQQKVRVLPIAGQDPESRKAKLMKHEEEQLRAHMRKEAHKRRMREKAHTKGLNAHYLDDRLDEDDESGAISVSAIKNRFKSGAGPGRNIYTTDSESDDEKRLTNTKRLESDDSSDEAGKSKDKSTDGEKKKKKYVSDSDSEEETSAPVAEDANMETKEQSSNSE